jgi:hypothetical protein
MSRYRLEGAVQARVGSRAHTQSPAGVNLPLEMSILNHVRTMDRIFEFRSRAVYNFERVTVMVANMPLGDPDLCGRIRDNLATAAQGAESRLAALETSEARTRSQSGIVTALKSLESTLLSFKEAHKSHRLRSSELAFDIEQDLARSFVHLGLTTGQERFLEDMLRTRIAELMQIVDQGDGLEKILTQLLDDLAALSGAGA